MRDITTFFDWFIQQFFSIINSCLTIINSFTIHGVSLLLFIISAGLIAYGLEVVISIHKDDERIRIKKQKSNKKGAN